MFRLSIVLCLRDLFWLFVIIVIIVITFKSLNTSLYVTRRQGNGEGEKGAELHTQQGSENRGTGNSELAFLVVFLCRLLVLGFINRGFRKQDRKMKSPNTCLLFVWSVFVVSWCSGFYLPGLAPVSFCEKGSEGDAVECHVRFYCCNVAGHFYNLVYLKH